MSELNDSSPCFDNFEEDADNSSVVQQSVDAEELENVDEGDGENVDEGDGENMNGEDEENVNADCSSAAEENLDNVPGPSNRPRGRPRKKPISDLNSKTHIKKKRPRGRPKKRKVIYPVDGGPRGRPRLDPNAPPKVPFKISSTRPRIIKSPDRYEEPVNEELLNVKYPKGRPSKKFLRQVYKLKRGYTRDSSDDESEVGNKVIARKKYSRDRDRKYEALLKERGPIEKRGRPRKYPSASTPVKVAKGNGKRGRPRKDPSASTPVKVAKGNGKRGRPRKDPSASTPVKVAKGNGKRGRPRKTPIPDSNVATTSNSGPPRKRGRPKKQSSDSEIPDYMQQAEDNQAENQNMMVQNGRWTFSEDDPSTALFQGELEEAVPPTALFQGELEEANPTPLPPPKKRRKGRPKKVVSE